MLKILKNTIGAPIPIPDTGVTIDPGDQYMVEPADYELWERSEDVAAEILAGTIVVNDGEDDLIPRIGIAMIQDNQIVLNEHYTLVQGGAVLVGNGQILHLNEDFPTTDNVDYNTLAEIIEEDDPPEED